MSVKKVGVIGGSGLYEMEGLKNIEKHTIETPFGAPSDSYISGDLGDLRVYFLPRHGIGHRYLPSEVPYRANIYGFRMLGAEMIISVSAVGSLKEEIVPGHMVVPDQFFDRTKNRPSTFFGDGVVAHVGFGDPVCPVLRKTVVDSAKKVGATVHDGGTYVCMEGPIFSTRAESFFYRSLKASVIGMTNVPEVKLAREAEMNFATLALATDYDCWHQSEDDVEVHAVLEVMKKNVATARAIVKETLLEIPKREYPKYTLDGCIMTDPKRIPEEAKKRLSLLIGPYLK